MTQNNLRKFALGLGLCGTMFSSTAIAMISPDASFHPIHGWDVQALHNEETGKRCSIATEFNNGFVVQLGGTQGTIDGLSINLRQDVFETGSTQNIDVSVPGQKMRTLDAKAFNEELLVVNFKNQNVLFDAMRTSGVLDVKLDENSFRFYMTGFSGALKKFDACMGQQPGAAYANKNPIVDNEPSRTSPSKATTQMAQKANNAYQDEIASIIEESPEEILAEIKTKPKVEPAKTSPKHHEVIKPQEIDLEELKEFAGQTDTKEKKAQKAKDDIVVELVNEKPKAAPMAAKEIEKPQKRQVTKSTPKIKVTREQFKAELDIADTDLPIENVPTIKTETPGFSKDMRKMVALEEKVKILAQENKQLNLELNRSLRASEKERLDIASDNWNLEQATMKYNEAERQIKKLGQQIQKERAKWSMEKKELEMMLFDPELTSQAQLARLANLEKELANKDAELQELRLKYETQKRQLNETF